VNAQNSDVRDYVFRFQDVLGKQNRMSFILRRNYFGQRLRAYLIGVSYLIETSFY